MYIWFIILLSSLTLFISVVSFYKLFTAIKAILKCAEPKSVTYTRNELITLILSAMCHALYAVVMMYGTVILITSLIRL